MGFAVPAFFIGEKAHSKDDFIKYLTVQNIMVTILCVPILIIAQNKPKNPPS